MRQIFALKLLSVAIGALYIRLQCCHRLEKRTSGTWNLAINKATEKSSLGCARTLSEASWLSSLEHLHHSSKVFHSHSSCCCQQRTSDLAEVGLKPLPFQRHICDICGMYHSIYIMIMTWVSQHYLFNCTCSHATCNKLFGKMCSSKHFR